MIVAAERLLTTKVRRTKRSLGLDVNGEKVVVLRRPAVGSLDAKEDVRRKRAELAHTLRRYSELAHLIKHFQGRR